MNGIFLIGFFILAAIFFIIALFDDYNDDGWIFASIVSACLGLIWLIVIPVSRMDSKTNAEKAIVLQQTIDKNRENPKEFDVLERTAIIKNIISYNEVIATWKVKGQKWYNNKWYYHPNTQKAEYIK